MLVEWQRDLEWLAAELRLRTPSLVLKRSRFSPIWCPAAWGVKPGAWAGFNKIVVAEAALEFPPEIRRYLLAHELGHVAKAHAQGQTIALAVVLLCAAPSLVAHHAHLPAVFKLVCALIFFGAALYFSRLAFTYAAEYEADEIAMRLIGRRQVVYGILEMARLSGEGLTAKRRNRLRRLGAPFVTR
jgi:Zn-dependent protease with chaperone function